MHVVYSTEDSLGRIVLSDPPYNYLLKPEFEKPETLRNFLSRPELKGVIVSGAGRHFCGGADAKGLGELANGPDRLGRAMEKGKALLDIVRYATVPVVAAVRGGCFGAGLEIALACHFRFASKSALFGFPESQENLMPGLGGTLVSQEIVRRRHVIDLVVSGRMIGAAEAESMGLVDKCCNPKDVENDAKSFLDRLTRQRPCALIRKIMESVNNARRLPLASALRRETELFSEALREHYGAA